MGERVRERDSPSISSGAGAVFIRSTIGKKETLTGLNFSLIVKPPSPPLPLPPPPPPLHLPFLPPSIHPPSLPMVSPSPLVPPSSPFSTSWGACISHSFPSIFSLFLLLLCLACHGRTGVAVKRCSCSYETFVMYGTWDAEKRCVHGNQQGFRHSTCSSQFYLLDIPGTGSF